MLRRLFVLLVLGSLVLTACGGDDGGGSDGGGTDATGGGDATGGDGDATGVFGAAECAEVAAAMAAAAQGAVAAMSGSTEEVQQSVEQLEQFSEDVPEEIRADLATIAEGYRAVTEALAGADFDPASGEAPPPEVIAALEQATQDLNTEEFQAAADRVNAYVQAGCEG
jgi:hypothetical protein